MHKQNQNRPQNDKSKKILLIPIKDIGKNFIIEHFSDDDHKMLKRKIQKKMYGVSFSSAEEREQNQWMYYFAYLSKIVYFYYIPHHEPNILTNIFIDYIDYEKRKKIIYSKQDFVNFHNAVLNHQICCKQCNKELKPAIYREDGNQNITSFNIIDDFDNLIDQFSNYQILTFDEYCKQRDEEYKKIRQQYEKEHLSHRSEISKKQTRSKIKSDRNQLLKKYFIYGLTEQEHLDLKEKNFQTKEYFKNSFYTSEYQYYLRNNVPYYSLKKCGCEPPRLVVCFNSLNEPIKRIHSKEMLEEFLYSIDNQKQCNQCKKDYQFYLCKFKKEDWFSVGAGDCIWKVDFENQSEFLDKVKEIKEFFDNNILSKDEFFKKMSEKHKNNNI